MVYRKSAKAEQLFRDLSVIVDSNASGSVPTDSVAQLQGLLRSNGLKVKITKILDEETVTAIKDFQRTNLYADGYPLEADGRLYYETIEALFNVKKRIYFSIFSFLFLIIALCNIYFWNSNFWFDDSYEQLKFVINAIVIFFGAVLLGIHPLSVLLPPAASRKIKAFWYRIQSSIFGMSLVFLIMGISISLWVVFPPQSKMGPIPKIKNIIDIALVLNGDAPYSRDASNGFIKKVDELFS